jgi:hypothetical protein
VIRDLTKKNEKENVEDKEKEQGRRGKVRGEWEGEGEWGWDGWKYHIWVVILWCKYFFHKKKGERELEEKGMWKESESQTIGLHGRLNSLFSNKKNRRE